MIPPVFSEAEKYNGPASEAFGQYVVDEQNVVEVPSPGAIV
jgi:hypothetical protein